MRFDGRDVMRHENGSMKLLPGIEQQASESHNPVRLLLITHDLNIGGLQRVVVDIALNLDPARYVVSVLALRDGGPFEADLREAGIPVYRLPVTSGHVDYFAFWKIRRLMVSLAPDIVHTHNTQPFIEGTLAAMLAGRPAVVHTDHGRRFPDKRRYMWMEWLASKAVAGIVSVSEDNKASLVTHEHIAPSLIRVIPNGIDGKKYQATIDGGLKRAALGLEPDAWPVLGWCGRLSPEKGLSVLLRAVPDLVRQYPRLRLVLAGDGILRKELESQAEEAGIAAHVRFLGARSDVPEVLQLLDLFVLPSLREGLPLVLLEAMAAGLPIVATDVGGNHQAVTDGVTGYLVPSEHPEALAQVIGRLLHDDTMRRRFSDEARRRFAEQFTIGRMVERYDDVYRQCLANRRRVA